MKPIYLDHNATTPLHPEALEAMLPYLKESYGNPSSVYQLGQKVRKAVEEARETMAKFIGAESPDEIIFTSGATEGNNQAIKGALNSAPRDHKRIVVSAIEHSSVRNVAAFLNGKGLSETVTTPVLPQGTLNLGAWKESFTPETALASLMSINNETGVRQPVKEAGKIAKKSGAVFHVDAVQSAGKEPIEVNEWGVDLLTLSGHKFEGPKGVGILYVRKGTRMEALLQGGSHEKNRRAGTENVPGIIGMAKAAEIQMNSMKEKNKTILAIREQFEKDVLKSVPKTFVNGAEAERASNTSNICFEYVDSSELLMALDLKGVAASSGSACQTGSVEASHVLMAMGLPQDQAHSALRFSFGSKSTEEEAILAARAIREAVERLRESHPLWKEVANR